MYVILFNSIPFDIPVNAQSAQIDTHIPETVNAIKNQLNDFFISLNLLSSPAFFILKNKNVPNRKVQIIIKDERMIFPKLLVPSLDEMSTYNITVMYDKLPVRS